jgi:hypothetical protein
MMRKVVEVALPEPLIVRLKDAKDKRRKSAVGSPCSLASGDDNRGFAPLLGQAESWLNLQVPQGGMRHSQKRQRITPY